MKRVLNQSQSFRRKLKKILYLVVLFGVLLFLYSLGADPWMHFFENWPVFLVTATIHGVAIFVQAVSFRVVQVEPSNELILKELVRIWSFSGVVSVVAPVFAGLATRTTLLVQHGMSLSGCVSTSIRQIWMGLEYAFLFGGLAGFFVKIPGVEFFAICMILSGVLMVLMRVYGTQIKVVRWQWLESIKTPVLGMAHPWFIAQMLAMCLIYYVAFNGVGALIGLQDAMLLASITVLASLIVMIPNGFGVMDALWVMVARQSGLGLDESVGLAIMLRLSHLAAAVFIWGMLLKFECGDAAR